VNALAALNFKQGDDIATVKAAEHISIEPELAARNSRLPANFSDANTRNQAGQSAQKPADKSGKPVSVFATMQAYR
jgi:hypothetical protein